MAAQMKKPAAPRAIRCHATQGSITPLPYQLPIRAPGHTPTWAVYPFGKTVQLEPESCQVALRGTGDRGEKHEACHVGRA